MGFFFPLKNSKLNTIPKIQNQTQHTHNTNTPRKFKIKHNKLTIQTQRAPKSNTNPNLTLNPFKEHKSTSSET